MSKIIRVKNCGECPEKAWDESLERNYCPYDPKCRVVRLDIIEDWCPLEDAPKEK